MKPLHTNPLKQSRAEIRRRICEMPVSRHQVRQMQKVIDAVGWPCRAKLSASLMVANPLAQ